MKGVVVTGAVDEAQVANKRSSRTGFGTIAARSVRRSSGTIALELAAGASITLVVVALALNVCFAMLAYGINDRACRDAARAAGQGATAQEAHRLAQAIIRTYNTQNAFMAPIEIVNVTYTDFGGNPEPDTSPFVRVTTRSTAAMPAPIELIGETVFGRVVPVQKTYTFPIVRLTVNP